MEIFFGVEKGLAEKGTALPLTDSNIVPNLRVIRLLNQLLNLDGDLGSPRDGKTNWFITNEVSYLAPNHFTIVAEAPSIHRLVMYGVIVTGHGHGFQYFLF